MQLTEIMLKIFMLSLIYSVRDCNSLRLKLNLEAVAWEFSIKNVLIKVS